MKHNLNLCLDVPKRDHLLSVFYKRKKKRRVFRYFNKELSIFRAWNTDDANLLTEMMNEDFRKMKYHRMVKD